MFGIALGMDRRDFKQVAQYPKPIIVGLVSQFLLLPLVTFLLILFLKPDVYIAYGMLLVAACPGGNISNYIAYLSKANIALSITLTAFSTFIALALTPLNFAFYSELVTTKDSVDVPLQLDTIDMMKSIALLILLPLSIGLFIREKFPAAAYKIERPVKILSMFIFFGFIGLAIYSNFNVMLKKFDAISFIIFFHNAVAFATGYLFAKAWRLDEKNSRTISIETGIQNSGLGLVLIFNFFDGNPDMALIAAGWGIWHIVAGLGLSLVWRKTKQK
jgi:bile acid:Na+ symporter, BASS family